MSADDEPLRPAGDTNADAIRGRDYQRIVANDVSQAWADDCADGRRDEHLRGGY